MPAAYYWQPRAAQINACVTLFSRRRFGGGSSLRRYFVGAVLVSVFVAGAAVVVLALEVESEPLELDDSLVLLVVVSLVEPEVEPPVVLVVEVAEVPDVAVLPEVALSVL
ncbi:MAG: hypothetical protein ACKO80_05280 [Acidimicrobiaceae bacterium]